MCPKGSEKWHVKFISVQKHCSVFFSLVSYLFLINNMLLAPSENHSTESLNGRNLSKWTLIIFVVNN